MTLRQTRCAFSRVLGKLLAEMERAGYEYAVDWVKRTAECNVGKLGSRSTHVVALAADIHLYRDGQYLNTTEAHRRFGEWWEQQHPLARWGGRFGDGNHYSFEWKGVK